MLSVDPWFKLLPMDTSGDKGADVSRTPTWQRTPQCVGRLIPFGAVAACAKELLRH